MQNNILKIKIRNNVLYQSDWVNKVDFILRSLNLECSSINEFHIALDSEGIGDNILLLYNSPFLRLRRGGLTGTDNSQKEFNIRKGFHFNRKTSDLFITFYDKTLHYAEKSYVKDFHELNNLRGTIHRIEVRVKKPSSLRLNNLHWKELGVTENLISLFKEEFQSRIVFNKTNETLYDKNRNKKYPQVNPIEFPSTNVFLKKKAKTKPAIENLKSVKNAVKILYLQTIRNNRQYNVLALSEMIDQNNLLEWFEAKRHHWGVFSPETVELAIDQINEQPILPEPTKPFGWVNKLLSMLVIVKFPEWKYESLAIDDHLLNASILSIVTVLLCSVIANTQRFTI